MLGRLAPRSVLIVEDSVLIAMEAEESLREFGCRDISVVGVLADAIEIINDRRFDFVLLDVNLGDETTDTIALRLRADGVPFATATGYGETIADREAFHDAPVLTKPYSKEDLLLVLRDMLAGEDQDNP